MNTEVRNLLDELTTDQPGSPDDLDQLIARGRRRGRIRNGAAGAISLALAAGLTGGALAIRPDANGQPVADLPSNAPAVSEPVTPVNPEDITWRQTSTQKSKDLARELRRLAPEIGQVPGARLSDRESFRPDGTPDRNLHAESLWMYRVGDLRNSVHLSVEVGETDNVPAVCDGMEPGVNQCTEVRRLADGSTAYIHNYTAGGAHQYEVHLALADDTRVYVGSGAQMPPGSTHDAPVSAARVLEIAQRITVRP